MMKRSTFLWLSALASLATSMRKVELKNAASVSKLAAHPGVAGRCVAARKPLAWSGYTLADLT